MTYKDLTKKIAGLFKIYRKRKGLSQPKLAEKLDISFKLIEKYESGSNLPRFHTLLRIAEVLEIPGSEIFGKEYDKLDLQELSKTYSKYDKFIQEFAEDEKLRDLVKQYLKEKYKPKA